MRLVPRRRLHQPEQPSVHRRVPTQRRCTRPDLRFWWRRRRLLCRRRRADERARALALAVDPSNSNLIVAGSSTTTGTAYVARLQSNGAPASWGTSGHASTVFASIDILGVAVQGTNVVVAGCANQPTHNANTPIVGRYNSGGSADTGFGNGANGAPSGYQFVDGSIGGGFDEIGCYQGITARAPATAMILPPSP